MLPHLPIPIKLDNSDFNQIELNVLKKWKKESTFQYTQHSLQEFVFYDGPPFANGLPHYGHILTGFIKDAIARYKTMNGYKVERRIGWDCHGLPVEMNIEKNLNISGSIAVRKYGIEHFNKHCKDSVTKYTSAWKSYIVRQARWIDFNNNYKTMDKDYMETVIWVFKELYKKKLVYKSMKVVPYSWSCETAVSDFETRIDNSYRKKTSNAVTIKIPLIGGHKIIPGCKSIYLVVWTTTPWTLPCNLAIAVGKDIIYDVVYKDNEAFIIGENLLFKYKNEIGTHIIKKVKGSVLLNFNYHPPFNYFLGHRNAFKVLHGNFVTTDEGTSIVHVAPGFGEDDRKVCQDNNIQLVCPVDSAGKFLSPIKDYIGKQVFQTNEHIITRLKKTNLFIKTDNYIHNYPHCWRTDEPLIYKAIPSWYIKVTEIKEKMIRNNNKINWIPGHIKKGLFGKWLRDAKDWSVSRNRFWGCPIPIWESDDPKYPCIEVYGSIQEIENVFQTKVVDLHRPFIDSLTKPNPNDPTGKSSLKRVPEILDCWFESGAMPYASIHYPFKNKEWFNNHFPADFTVEYLAQTRGWFYTLMVISTALFDKPPFLNCICHGTVLSYNKQKLSKRLQNYPDLNKIFSKYGADSVRWFMLSSPVMKGQELIIDKNNEAIKNVYKSALQPLWNAFNFYLIYSKIDMIKSDLIFTSTNVLDQYIIAKLAVLVKIVKESFSQYDTIKAIKSSEIFLEILNNWFIRRSRQRFWKKKKDYKKIQAYNTLFSVLHVFTRIIAPILPMVTEAIFSHLSQSSASIHLEKFPYIDTGLCNNSIISNMEKVREACSTALKIRNTQKIRIRQPLTKVLFIGVLDIPPSKELEKIILDEINVKHYIHLGKEKISEYANYELKLNFPEIAKKLPTKIKDIIKAAKLGSWKIMHNGTIIIADNLLNPNDYNLKLLIKEKYKNRAGILSTSDAIVLLDININQDLKYEGTIRDIIRVAQQERKNIGCNITDTIILEIDSSSSVIHKSLDIWSEYLKEQTLSTKIIRTNTSGNNNKNYSIESGYFSLRIVKI